MSRPRLLFRRSAIRPTPAWPYPPERDRNFRKARGLIGDGEGRIERLMTKQAAKQRRQPRSPGRARALGPTLALVLVLLGLSMAHATAGWAYFGFVDSWGSYGNAPGQFR